MTILQTPAERFANLKDYPFAPHFVEVAPNLQMHYVDEGNATDPVVLMLHGEPSWSYLYRKMIPIVRDAGYRVIAPDLIGFGKSDKIVEKEAYSYQSHVDWITKFIKALDLQGITLVCQDWGGLIGLRVAAENEARFARISAANTFLPTGEQPGSEAFMQWRAFSQSVPVFPTSFIINGAVVTKLSADELAAYDAPFPDESYKAAARMFPILVPITPDDPAANANKKAWEVLMKWEKPFLTCFSDQDPITKGGEKALQKLIPGCAGQPHVIIENGGHFLQEDKGEEWAEKIVAFMKGS
jgi:haloalkane dehalogenase